MILTNYFTEYISGSTGHALSSFIIWERSLKLTTISKVYSWLLMILSTSHHRLKTLFCILRFICKVTLHVRYEKVYLKVYTIVIYWKPCLRRFQNNGKKLYFRNIRLCHYGMYGRKNNVVEITFQLQPLFPVLCLKLCVF